MGKLRRGALWVTFWPAGAVASVRAGQRKDAQRIVSAIEKTNVSASSSAGVPRRRGGAQGAWSEYSAHQARKRAKKKDR